MADLTTLNDALDALNKKIQALGAAAIPPAGQVTPADLDALVARVQRITAELGAAPPGSAAAATTPPPSGVAGWTPPAQGS